MSTTEILLAGILVGVMAMVSLGVMSIMSKHHWETRSRLEKLKKLDSNHETLRAEYNLFNSWKGHISFFANAILYGGISSFALYFLLSFFLS
jgi:ABC-type antimicrobial peptide transport system permease subunit